MSEQAGKCRCAWPYVVAAVSIAVLTLGLVVWMVPAPLKWATVARYLIFLPASLAHYCFGRQTAGPVASAGASFFLLLIPLMLPLISAFLSEGLSPHVVGRLFADGFFFPAIMLTVSGEFAVAPSQRPPKEPAVLGCIGSAISDELDLGATLDPILSSTRQLIPYDVAEITLWDEERKCCVTQGWGGDPAYAREAGGSYYLDEGYTGWIARNRCSLFIPDVQARRDVRPKLDTPEYPFRSYVGMPLQIRGRFIGTLELASYQKNAWSERDLEILQAVANQAAVAIENAYLYDAMRRRASELASLTAISATISESLELERVLRTIASAVLEVVGCQRSAIFVLDDAQQVLRLAMTQGLSEEYAAQSQVLTLEYGGRAHAVVTGEPLVISDVQADASLLVFAPMSTQEGFRALADLPLKRADRVIGMLSVVFAEPHRFTETEVELLTAFADQAAIAIENARLYAQTDEELRRREEALRRRNRELATLYGAATAISFNLSLDAVLETVTDQMTKALNSKGCALSLWDRERNVVETLVDYSMTWAEPPGTTYDLDDYPATRRVLETRQPMVIQRDDPTADQAELALMEKQGIQTLLMLPLIARGQVLGLVELIDEEEARDYTLEELLLAEGLAAQAAIAIENARLFEEVRRLSQELERRVEERTQALAEAMRELTVERDRVETLYRITSRLSTSLDLDYVLNRALALVVEAVGAERASALMLEARSGQLIHRVALGAEVELPVGGIPTCFYRGYGLAGWVVEHREAAIVPDIRKDHRWVEPREKERKYRSALAVPLLHGDEVLGALLLFHVQPDFFDEDHLLLVEAVATQVANAIHNAELYSLIHDQANRLGSMLKAQQVEAAKSRAILEGVADGVLVADADGEVILFNAAAERILELPREEAVGRTINEMLGLYGSQARDWMETLAKWAEQPDMYTAEEYLAAHLNIGDRIVSVHLAPVLMSYEFLGTVSVFRDVTAEVEAGRTKIEFVSTVSHELRTPITSVKGYADLLLMGTAGILTDDQRNFISIIRNNADRLTVLVSDLLDISCIESGQMEFSPKVMCVEGVVNQVIVAMEARAEDKGLTLQRDVPPDLPSVIADSDRVTQILTNLVANAYQYTPTGGEIVVSARVCREKVHISVRDTGIGIAPEDQDKIFDRFFRADDPLVQDVPGTGLGLAIVKSLVEMHGEQVWVDSELRVGSTFTFTLPIAEARRVARVEEASEQSSTKELVVEDDLDADIEMVLWPGRRSDLSDAGG